MNGDLTQLRAVIADLPPEDRRLINNLAESLRGIVRHYGDAACIALSLVAGELADEQREEEKP